MTTLRASTMISGRMHVALPSSGRGAAWRRLPAAPLCRRTVPLGRLHSRRAAAARRVHAGGLGDYGQGELPLDDDDDESPPDGEVGVPEVSMDLSEGGGCGHCELGTAPCAALVAGACARAPALL